MGAKKKVAVPEPETVAVPEPETVAEPKRDVWIEHLTWEGIDIEVKYEADWLGCNAKYGHRNAHLELRVPTKQPIPVTETGYKSQFLEAGTVEEHGGPAEYARLWITGSAKSVTWREYKKELAKPKQMDLFG